MACMISPTTKHSTSELISEPWYPVALTVNIYFCNHTQLRYSMSSIKDRQYCLAANMSILIYLKTEYYSHSLDFNSVNFTHLHWIEYHSGRGWFWVYLSSRHMYTQLGVQTDTDQASVYWRLAAYVLISLFSLCLSYRLHQACTPICRWLWMCLQIKSVSNSIDLANWMPLWSKLITWFKIIVTRGILYKSCEQGVYSLMWGTWENDDHLGIWLNPHGKTTQWYL